MKDFVSGKQNWTCWLDLPITPNGASCLPIKSFIHNPSSNKSSSLVYIFGMMIVTEVGLLQRLDHHLKLAAMPGLVRTVASGPAANSLSSKLPAHGTSKNENDKRARKAMCVVDKCI